MFNFFLREKYSHIKQFFMRNKELIAHWSAVLNEMEYLCMPMNLFPPEVIITYILGRW